MSKGKARMPARVVRKEREVREKGKMRGNCQGLNRKRVMRDRIRLFRAKVGFGRRGAPALRATEIWLRKGGRRLGRSWQSVVVCASGGVVELFDAE